MILPETLQQLLRYDPETGLLYWRERTADQFEAAGFHTPEHRAKNWNARYAGKECFNTIRQEGYCKGNIQTDGVNVTYQSHRVAWAIYYGAWPAAGMVVDHINRIRTDNRIANLRVVTKSANSINGQARSDCKSGLRGVYLRRRTGRKRWLAFIKHNGKKRHLGTFDTPQEAVRARKDAEAQVFASLARNPLPLEV